MGEPNPPKKSKLRQQSPTSTPTPSTITVTPTVPPTPQPAAIQISEAVRDQITSLMQELLMKTHELSFEYSTLECDEITQCPLGQKCKDLFRTVKELTKLVRQMQQPTSTPYVS